MQRPEKNFNNGLIREVWRTTIGQHSFMGWFTIYSYYSIGLLSLIISIPRVKKAHDFFWTLLSFLLLILGFFRHSDILMFFPAFGRRFFESYGIIEQHRFFQALVMVLILAAGILLFKRIYRSTLYFLFRKEKMAAFGISYLIMFAIQKSISLHQYGVILSYRIMTVRIEWIAELLGIYWILFWLVLDVIEYRKEQNLT